MCEAFERAVITHCAPTLARHKCANLFVWHGCPGRTPAECVRELDAALCGKGVRLRILKENKKGCLVYVYRPRMLERKLKDAAIGAFLKQRGYTGPDMENCLRNLTDRIADCAEFPHEIGVFLDYPLADVIGFMENRGAGYRCQGCWKAYSNEQEALRRFRLYRKCREVYLSCYRRGFDVVRLTVAA